VVAVAHRESSSGVGPPARTAQRRTGPAWLAIYVCLGIGIVVPLLVFIYDQEKPTFLGFPFYYWFQFALIPIVSALTYLAFRLSLRATERDRAAFGLRRDERPQNQGKDD
jgi:bacteriorhodopsin